MRNIFIIVAFLIAITSAFPMGSWLRKIAENSNFDQDFDNYLPKTGDLPKNEYSVFSDFKKRNNDLIVQKNNETNYRNTTQNFKQTQPLAAIIRKENLTEGEKPKMFDEVVDFVKDGAEAGMELYKDMKNILAKAAIELSANARNLSDFINRTNLTGLNETKAIEQLTTEFFNETGTIPYRKELDPVFVRNLTALNETANRPARQESDEDDDVPSSPESSEEEEDGNMITGLIGAFLSGLSRPDGGVDVDAIVALLGSLSAQNPDGSFDFSGLTEALMAFLGGSEDEGGSNFGAFLGGLLGAFLQGVAKPPGPQGVGVLTGNVLGGILPALSGPPPSSDDNPQQDNPGSAGFFTGLLSTLLGSGSSGIGQLSGSSSGSPGGGSGGGGSKFSIFKAIFSMFTSIFTSSSGASGRQ